MKHIAVFPGTFDPITIGHVDIINRAQKLFDEVIIAIGTNAAKQAMFSVELRMQWIYNSFPGNHKIKVYNYEGLTVDFCKQHEAGYIIRGLRSSADFDYENGVAQTNLEAAGIESVSFFSKPEHVHIASSIVRDILRHGGNASRYMASGVSIQQL